MVNAAAKRVRGLRDVRLEELWSSFLDGSPAAQPWVRGLCAGSLTPALRTCSRMASKACKQCGGTIRLKSLDTPTPSEGDPLAPFRQLRDPRPTEACPHGLMVIEGEIAVSRVLQARPQRCQHIVATPAVAQRLRALIPPPRAGAHPNFHPPILEMDAARLRELCGFAFHRGCLASLTRPPFAVEPIRSGGVVAVGVCDPRNLGAILRNASAFGASGLWLGPRCADPFSRQASRASMGLNLSLPVHQTPPLVAALKDLAARGVTNIAAALGPQSTPLARLVPPRAWSLWVGNEGHGLPEDLLEHCDHRVHIPMAPGVDSINVATASGVFLYHLSSPSLREPAS